MSYITLGNLTRFLNKLKNYLDKNYFKLTGGTILGETNFSKQIRAPSIKLDSDIYPLTVVAEDYKLKRYLDSTDKCVILDENTYLDYVPNKTGAGATGTWSINISGNARNDSDGNKIVDTYAKKSEVGSNITVDNALSATSTNPVQNKVIKGELDNKLDARDDATRLSLAGGSIQVDSYTDNGRVGINLGNRQTDTTKNTLWLISCVGPKFFIENSNAYGTNKQCYLTLDSDGVAFNGNMLVMQLSNGHISINGSELWVE